MQYKVVDLFAGPGGLAEGFAAFRSPEGDAPFRIVLSVEKEAAAHRTLHLRSFLRQFSDGFPPAYAAILKSPTVVDDFLNDPRYADERRAADQEAHRLELGDPEADELIDEILSPIPRRQSILIGGPPCQAYSLVGRARNKGIAGYVAEKDGRHYLYREYIRILRQLEPAAFVMENVKGILSSRIDGASVFLNVANDLRDSGYHLFPLGLGTDEQNTLEIMPSADPRRFIVRSEVFGIPQARHRVIIVGIHESLIRDGDSQARSLRLMPKPEVTVEQVIGSMPRLRSGLSRTTDDAESWREHLEEAIAKIRQLEKARKITGGPAISARFTTVLSRVEAELSCAGKAGRASSEGGRTLNGCPKELRQWLRSGADTRVLPNHESRTHMSEDLTRYLFAAVYAEAAQSSPKASEFPKELAPAHKNWRTGKFADRFRVQLADRPSSTITSHISKDGHYFIHPDPSQCRSLTVREAARLQTFPDDYLFLGNRTQQYVQVGNAVPPFLARQIAGALYKALTC